MLISPARAVSKAAPMACPPTLCGGDDPFDEVYPELYLLKRYAFMELIQIS